MQTRHSFFDSYERPKTRSQTRVKIQIAKTIHHNDLCDVVKRSYEEAFLIDWKKSYNKPLTRDIGHANCICLIAYHGGVASGMIKIYCKEKSAEIDKLYVLPSKQGLGIGHKLMQAALLKLQVKGLISCSLKVWDGNESAIKFYQKHHFHKEKEVEYITPSGECTGVINYYMVCNDIRVNLVKYNQAMMSMICGK